MARSPLSAESRQRGALLAQNLKAERERKRITQAELARRANVPIDTVRSIENGRVLVPGVFVIFDLSNALGADLTAWLQERG